MAKQKKTKKTSDAKPGIRKRVDMEVFLGNHPRYFTSSSSNGPTSYANEINLGNITGPKAFDDDAVKALTKSIADGSYPCEEWDNTLIEMIQGFTKTYGYMPGFSGPNAEWLVLRIAAKDDKTGEYAVYPNKALDKNNEFHDMKIAELRERTKLVIAFDELCEEIRNRFIDTVLSGHLFERPLTKRKKERFFSVCDLDQFLKDNPGITHIYSVPENMK